MKKFLSKTFLLLCILSLTACIQPTDAQDQLITKLFRFGEVGAEKPGVVLPNGKMLDVSGFGEDYNEQFFQQDGIVRLRKWVAANLKSCPEVPSESRLATCIARPSKIVAIGRNYVEHAKETGSAVPEEPIIFMKATTSLMGPNDPVVIPKNAEKVDWEVELAIVIGKKAKHVKVADALDYVAGYTIMNDYTERSWQKEGTGQWTKGKSPDTFGPLGPYLITPEAIKDPQRLRLWLKVNGKTMQDGNTSDMIFSVAELISYVSTMITLLPGDVLATGTPSGVGAGMKPPKYLQPGEVVELGIDGIGSQKQMVVSYQSNE
ncbi:MAG TPA: ureidoglycolate lyase [Cytophagales bacterium]|nr:ureidoglycolate lyase [Cytophagales bacterium]